MPLQDTRQQQNQQIIQSTQFNDLMFQSSISQFLQQQQTAQGGAVNVSQPPSYTTVISKNNPKPTLKTLVTSRGKHQQANIVYNSKSLDNISTAYTGTQQQPQQNLTGQSIDRICKYFFM